MQSVLYNYFVAGVCSLKLFGLLFTFEIALPLCPD